MTADRDYPGRREIEQSVRMTGRAVVLVIIAMTAACAGGSHDRTVAPSSSSTSTSRAPTRSAQPTGDPASWFLKHGENLTGASQSFTANVYRLACNGGITGTVLRPTINIRDKTIVVTFTVKRAQRGLHHCQGNRPVLVVVNLGTPIGNRRLIDGACRPGSRASKTQACSDGQVRWPSSGA